MIDGEIDVEIEINIETNFEDEENDGDEDHLKGDEVVEVGQGGKWHQWSHEGAGRQHGGREWRS